MSPKTVPITLTTQENDGVMLTCWATCHNIRMDFCHLIIAVEMWTILILAHTFNLSLTFT